MNKIFSFFNNALYLMMISVVHIMGLLMVITVFRFSVGIISSIIAVFLGAYGWLVIKRLVQMFFKKGRFEDVFNSDGELIRN